jgi:hypothetical protein
VGLDVVAYRTAVLTEPHPNAEACVDLEHIPAFHLGFEQSFRGLIWERCYECRGEDFYFRAGTYRQHAQFRQVLARAALNVDADDIYADPGPFRDKPFFELIFFADTEGCIGPLAAADLAADFAQGRDTGVRAGLNEVYHSLYDDWSRAFTLASGGGLVHFH